MLQNGRVFPSRVYRAVLSLLVLVITSGAAAMSEGKDQEEKIALRVLYAGNPDSDRMQAFTRLLEEHFAKVGTADYRKFSPSDADDFDVVIFDWTSIYPRDASGKIIWNQETPGISQPEPPKLDRTFSRPAILIGAAGGGMSHQLQTAINWKCLCLENVAHDLNKEHAIFQGPLPVKLEYHEQKKPLDYYTAPGTEKIGEVIPVWKVQEKSFPEIDPGLVSTRESFVETPDAEVISGGFNGKGPTSVAIGRHGNFFLWGFSAQPSDMTESGRRAFINAVCYIDKFDGKAPGPVKQTHGGRDSLLESVYWLRSTSDDYINAQVGQFKKMIADNPPPEEQLKQIGDDPAAYFRKIFEPHAKTTLEKLPKSVRERCHDDTEQLIRYYRDNLEFLRSDHAGGFEVDDDVQKLGVSNRQLELLETCVAMLDKDEQADLARRVLERYTGLTHAAAGDWREWLQANHDKLRFDENNGTFVP